MDILIISSFNSFSSYHFLSKKRGSLLRDQISLDGGVVCSMATKILRSWNAGTRKISWARTWQG